MHIILVKIVKVHVFNNLILFIVALLKTFTDCKIIHYIENFLKMYSIMTALLDMDAKVRNKLQLDLT